MKKMFKVKFLEEFSLFLVLLLIFLVKIPSIILAVDNCPRASISPGICTEDNTITVWNNEIYKGNSYHMQISTDRVCAALSCQYGYLRIENVTAQGDGSVSTKLTAGDPLLFPGTHKIILENIDKKRDLCQYELNVGYPRDCSWEVSGNPWTGQEISITLDSKILEYFSSYRFEIKKPGGSTTEIGSSGGKITYVPTEKGVYRFTFFFSFTNNVGLNPKKEEVSTCSVLIDIGENSNRPGRGKISSSQETTVDTTKKLCQEDTGPCADCFNQGNTWTALGCIPTNDLNGFAGWILGKFVFIASGIAFLLMAFGAFQITTSSGDPKKMQGGKELITSALSGLLFIILSIFLLKLIGVDILRIPGFGS